jgi:hypothetical protein
MVVPDNKSRERIHRISGSTGFDRDIHAWKDSHSKNIPDPDIPRPFMAEDPLVRSYGLVSGAGHVTVIFVNRHSTKIDHPS